MTVVRPNSIAGINSITVQTGQALNIHDASGNLIRNITSSSGVSTFSSLHVGSGTTTNTQGISVGTGCSIVSGTVNTLELYTNNSERIRLDSGGRLLIGTAANQHNSGDLLQLAAESSTASLGLNRFTANAHPSYINFFKSRNASLSGQTVVQDGDNLGQITWAGSDGTNRAYAAFLDAEVDGTPGDGDMPGRITFSTSPDGSESPAERMRIDKSGNVLIGTTSATSELTVRGGGTVAAFEGTGGNTAIMFVDVDNSKNLFLQNSNGVFNVQTSGSSYATKLSVTESGQVGVNTVTFNTGSKLEVSSEGAYGIISRSQNGNGGYHVFTGQSSGGTNTSYITHNGRGYFEDGVQFDSSGEVLDSYEEGSWTPVPARYTGGNANLSMSTQNGKYTKIGNLVRIEFYIVISSVTSQGSSLTQLRGLPFSPNASYQNTGVCFYNDGFQHDDDTDYTIITTVHQDNSGVVYFKANGCDAGNGLSTKNFQAGTITGSCTYLTDS